MKYLGNYSAVDPAYSRYMECHDCGVSWTGCWDNFQCPQCGEGELPHSDIDLSLGFKMQVQNDMETLNNLYLALSKVVTAKTDREVQLEKALERAYCEKVGADTTHGLQVCNDFLVWRESLMPSQVIRIIK